MKLIYEENGEPLSVLKLVEDCPPTELEPGQVHVKVLLSPINPSDVMCIRGTHPSRPPVPATPGLEGVAEVVSSKSAAFQPGDRVLVRRRGFGMWRQNAVANETELQKVPKELPREAAATLIVNPCTAYLMLKHIVPLQAGDSLIQNGANSALGQIIIQLARSAGIKTINVIRKREKFEETAGMLKELGADTVITDEQLRQGFEKLNLGLPAPKLGLECVCGEASNDMALALAQGGTLVTYGNLSDQMMQLDQLMIILKEITVTGFGLPLWIDKKPNLFANAMQEIIRLYTNGKLKLPKIQKFQLDEWQEALKMATGGFSNTKVFFKLN